MKKISKLIFQTFSIVNLIIATFIFISCSSSKKYTKANIVFWDGFKVEMLVSPNKSSYYSFIRSKYKTEDEKIKYLIPEEVISINGKDYSYVSMYFDEENFGMESYSFAKIIAGDTAFALVETKYQIKTCSCKTAGTFLKGIFLYASPSTYLKLKLDYKNNIYNRIEIAKFFKANSGIVPFDNINTLTDLIEYLNSNSNLP
ncbi:MAG TPA: hypothetical protein P5538_04865 [Bacteroidales bacterium]|nr:hypothetical protein [Bacteroidales bacterium]HOL98936.1 hypothetical protein [Bacteroidales bacterium]HOM36882.1 hypothetical protein [Bacteroidales bacterium]HPD24202.1 hypothetical protein [Bacteroidales bacterium]HRS99887.1 hypothetical protein [Bacteroidales bacterium]